MFPEPQPQPAMIDCVICVLKDEEGGVVSCCRWVRSSFVSWLMDCFPRMVGKREDLIRELGAVYMGARRRCGEGREIIMRSEGGVVPRYGMGFVLCE